MNFVKGSFLRNVVILAFLGAVTSCGSREDGTTTSGESGITGSGNVSVAPEVIGISPAKDSTGAYTDTPLKITFNVAVNTSTVTMTTNTTCTGSLQLSTDTNFGAGTCIAMNQSVTLTGTQITVKPAVLLSNTTQYFIRVTTAVAGSTALTMVTQYQSNFTTGTAFTPLTGEFGADCSAGADTLTTVRSQVNGAAINLSVANLVVSAIDTSGYFYLQQSGATGPAVYVRDLTNGSGIGVQVGDIVCVTITEKDEYLNWIQIDTISAIKKTGAGGSITPQVVTTAVTDDTYETEMVSVTGNLTTKNTSLSGSGYNHILTYAGGTMDLREIQGSGKFDNISQGQEIQVIAPMTQYNSTYQMYFDSNIGIVTEFNTGNFNVSSANSTGTNTLILTFNNIPTSATASNYLNYTGNNGLTITAASLSGITVTLTTSAQTIGQSYTITVANVLRNTDSATLNTNNANFTGYIPSANFTTGQVIINEVHPAPTPSAEEFIELYNTTASPVSLKGATLWYKASGGNPGQGSTLTGVIPANGYYTLLRTASPTSYSCTGSEQTTGWNNSGLSNTAGAVILTVDGTSPTAAGNANVRDIAQWGTNTTNWAQDDGGSTGPSIGAPRTFARAPNGIDTNNNGRDFLTSTAVPNNGTCGANNWSGDVTLPTITASTPGIGATDVALSSTISVTFSESMYVSSVSTSNLYLVQGTDCGATSITGSISTTNPNTTFTFPSGTLTANTQYSICIKTGVEDVALNNLAADAARSFTTVAPDVTAPSAISTLAAGTITSNSVVLNWTAVGDDAGTGTAASYEIRYGTGGSCPFDNANFSSTGTAVTSPPTPQAAGNAETKTVSGLIASTQYWFAIKVSDEIPNVSPISNCITATTSTPDVTAPSQISTLAAGTITSSSIVLNWTAVGDDAGTGTATSYEIRYGTGGSCPFDNANFSSTGTAVTSPPTPQAAGNAETKTVSGLIASTQYWFAMKVSDEVPNVSTLSNCITATTSAGGGTIPAGNSLALWTFETQVNTVTSTHENITSASSLLLNVDKNGGTSNWVGGCAPTGSNAYTDNTWNLATAALALADHYYEFTVTVQGGFSADLTALNFHYTRSATGAANYALYYSVDGYAAPIATGAMGTTTCTAISADLTAIANISGTVTFRLTGYGASGGTGTWRIDNVDLRN